MSLTAIVGGTVIDGTGRQPIDDAVVLVDGDRIRSVSTASDTVVPERATVIDATGRHVIPGLMDANVHLVTGLPPDLMLEFEGRLTDVVTEAAQVSLAAGVTTVFDTWGPIEPLITVRDRINRGEVVGSRMFAAGNIVGLNGPLSSDFFSTGNLFGPDTLERINHRWEQGVGRELLWLTAEGVRRRVRDYIERTGVDFVKYAGSGHQAEEMAMIAFSEAAQRAIVEEAHRAGLTVQAHTTSVESLRIEIEAGADILQHANVTVRQPIPEETLDLIVERNLPVAALAAPERFLAWVREHGGDLASADWTMIDENLGRLIKAGARLLLTTDALVACPRAQKHPMLAAFKDVPDSPIELGESHFRWLEVAVEHGLAPMDALLAATRNIAEAYRKDADLGTLEPGKLADLVILDGDPLEDVRNYRRITRVMKDGVLVDREALPSPRVLTEADPSTSGPAE